jgi:hypothetical protein
MTLLILTIGLLNLVLGFGLGIYLGYGPPGLLATWDALGTAFPQIAATEANDAPDQPTEAANSADTVAAQADLDLLAVENRLLEEIQRLRAECQGQLQTEYTGQDRPAVDSSPEPLPPAPSRAEPA